MKPSKLLRKVPRPGGLTKETVCVPEWCHFDDCPVCRLIKKSLIENREFSDEEWEQAFAEAEAQN